MRFPLILTFSPKGEKEKSLNIMSHSPNLRRRLSAYSMFGFLFIR